MENYIGWLAEVKTKQGVVLDTLKCEALIALRVAYDIYKDMGRKLTVTSTSDGAHKVGSLHYVDLAFDTRVWGLSEPERKHIVREAKSQLGPDYDVIDEVNHIHWEYDPKVRKD